MSTRRFLGAKALLRHLSLDISSRPNDLEPPGASVAGVTSSHVIRGGQASQLRPLGTLTVQLLLRWRLVSHSRHGRRSGWAILARASVNKDKPSSSAFRKLRDTPSHLP